MKLMEIYESDEENENRREILKINFGKKPHETTGSTIQNRSKIIEDENKTENCNKCNNRKCEK